MRSIEWWSMTMSAPQLPQITPICTFCTVFHIFFGLLRLMVASPSLLMTSHPSKGRGQVTWQFRILHPPNNSGTAKARYFKFCTIVGLRWLTIPQVGVVRVTWPISTFLGPGHIFEADEARHFKFRLQIERKKSSIAITHVKVLQYAGVFRVTWLLKIFAKNVC